MFELKHPIYIASYSFALSLLYFIVTAVVVFQIIRIWYYKHNLKGFQFGFLLLCLVWSILRAVFWLLAPLEPLPELALQGFSIHVQFATFTFLAFFYVHITNRSSWNSVKRTAVVLFTAINVLFLGAWAVQVVLAAAYLNPEDPHLIIATLVIAGIMFLVLSVLLAVYSWRLYHLDTVVKAHLPLLKNNKNKVALMTVLILLLFFSRAVRDFVAAAGVGQLTFKPPSNETVGEQLLLFAMYFAWELIPTGFVIALFWHVRYLYGTYFLPFRILHTTIPKTNTTNMPIFASYGAINGEVSSGGEYFRYGSSLSHGDDILSSEAEKSDGGAFASSKIFSDPQRYDSDDEDTRLPRKKKTVIFGVLASTSRTPSSFEPIKGFTPYNTTSPLNKDLMSD